MGEELGNRGQKIPLGYTHVFFMFAFDGNVSEAELDRFAASLPVKFFSHQNLMKCYSEYVKNEYKSMLETPTGSAEPYSRQISGGKRVPMRWSDTEVEALKNGIQLFGKGNWTKILDTYNHIFGPTARTGRDLKKKWLSLNMKQPSNSAFFQAIANSIAPGLAATPRDD